jgi:hypothetical protein
MVLAPTAVVLPPGLALLPMSVAAQLLTVAIYGLPSGGLRMKLLRLLAPSGSMAELALPRLSASVSCMLVVVSNSNQVLNLQILSGA